MAASHNLPHSSNPCKSHISKTGVLVVSGFGLCIRIKNAHLEIEDGVGMERRNFRLPRVGHGLRRLVCISEDGFITLSALKFLADIGVSFSMLGRTGKILFVAGPSAPSDARLRRAQALAIGNGVGLEIARTLISAKLEGQENLIRERLKDEVTGDGIAKLRDRLSSAEDINTIRTLEALGASLYFGAWRDMTLQWPKADLARIPDHWRTVGSRHSVLSGGPRLAVTPVHTILNYCFALLESETRLALATLGLDPGLGLGLHTDTPNRDSLALDVLEPVRPQVESWVFDWITREPLRRADFFETETGNCRLRSHLCAKLSQTSLVWGKLVAPWAEFVARTLWSRSTRSRVAGPSTPLTQQHRRESKGGRSFPTVQAPKLDRLCRGCGISLKYGKRHCASCGVDVSRALLIEAAKLGRIATHSAEAEALRSATQLRQVAARKAWQSSDKPGWLTEKVYVKDVQPKLSGLRNSTIAFALHISMPYAADIRATRRIPHARHRAVLAGLVGVKFTP